MFWCGKEILQVFQFYSADCTSLKPTKLFLPLGKKGALYMRFWDTISFPRKSSSVIPFSLFDVWTIKVWYICQPPPFASPFPSSSDVLCRWRLSPSERILMRVCITGCLCGRHFLFFTPWDAYASDVQAPRNTILGVYLNDMAVVLCCFFLLKIHSSIFTSPPPSALFPVLFSMCRFLPLHLTELYSLPADVRQATLLLREACWYFCQSVSSIHYRWICLSFPPPTFLIPLHHFHSLSKKERKWKEVVGEDLDGTEAM